MSKVKIEMSLNSSENNYFYSGLAIKNDDKITFCNDGIVTVITLKPLFTIERKGEYYIKLCFLANKIMKGTYNTAIGKFDIETQTISFINNNNAFEIKYLLKSNGTVIESFLLNFNFTIDTVQ